MLSKDNIDKYLEALSSLILEKFGPEARIKIVIVGGAAIALSCHFRDSTMDIDTYSKYSTLLESLAGDVADEHGLENDWLNHNVMVTQSFTERIENYAPLYKVFKDVLIVHVADPLSILCMKAVCCRPGSHDMFDIKNILDERPEITYDDIYKRFIALYGDLSKMKPDAQMMICDRFKRIPPDVVDYIYELLPPFMQRSITSEEEKYKVCYEQYCLMNGGM